ncbi:MAG: DUF2190 family protein [Planctomycetota bacterium]
MALEATFVRGDQNDRQHTLTADASPGEVINIGTATDERPAVVLGLNADALTSGNVAAVATTGVFDLLCASAVTANLNEFAYWDVSANTVIFASPAAGDLPLGVVVEKAKADGDTTVRIDLNVGGPAHADSGS